jgi:hypothetical protein
MQSCQYCRNVLFKPLLSDDDRGFEAILHPTLAALEDSALKKNCKFCLILHGIIRNRRIGLPLETPRHQEHISLELHYFEDGDWVGIDEGDNANMPRYIQFYHPMGLDNFRICNPQVISQDRLNGDEAPELETTDGHSEEGSPYFTDNSTGSSAALDLATSWIRDCKSGHPTCRRHLENPLDIPTRLLDLSSIEEQPRRILLVSSEEQKVRWGQVQYATLSHRWNMGRIILTTKKNLDNHYLNGISTRDLPAIFYEAAVTTKNLGIRYLWIDSLCIIQDSDEDKATEIPRMGYYYENAEVNISASSDGSGGGLWTSRAGWATRPHHINATFTLGSPWTRNLEVRLQLAPVLRGPTSHLDGRGWVLQERIFPIRTLFFDSYWISYECGEMSASESCPNGVRKAIGQNSRTLETEMGTFLNRDGSLAIIGGKIRQMEMSVQGLGKEKSFFLLLQMLVILTRIGII